jgi:hypothetical protein
MAVIEVFLSARIPPGRVSPAYVEPFSTAQFPLSKPRLASIRAARLNCLLRSVALQSTSKKAQESPDPSAHCSDQRC